MPLGQFRWPAICCARDAILYIFWGICFGMKSNSNEAGWEDYKFNWFLYYLPTVLSAYGFAVLRGFFAELPQTPQDGESAEANSGSDPAYHYRPPRGQPALPAIKVTCRYMSKTSHPRNKLPKWHKIWKATQSLQYMLLWAKPNCDTMDGSNCFPKGQSLNP
jgi:hypothetical protein